MISSDKWETYRSNGPGKILKIPNTISYKTMKHKKKKCKKIRVGGSL